MNAAGHTLVRGADCGRYRRAASTVSADGFPKYRDKGRASLRVEHLKVGPDCACLGRVGNVTDAHHHSHEIERVSCCYGGGFSGPQFDGLCFADEGAVGTKEAQLYRTRAGICFVRGCKYIGDNGAYTLAFGDRHGREVSRSPR